MKTSSFNYSLSPKYIAQQPAEPRDSSKLMVIDRKNKSIKHNHFYEIIDYLNSGDCLVINETRVAPARIFGSKTTGGKIEILLLNKIDNYWQALAKPSKRLREGDEIIFSNFSAKVIRKKENGIIEISSKKDIEKAINISGRLPLPPYIKDYKGPQKRYQTVYAKKGRSVAAPTAGLHFTENLLKKISEKSVDIITINLEISWETFRTVREENIEEHKIHSEKFSISKDAAAKINKAKSMGKNIIAVGTTSVRALESSISNKKLVAKNNDTDIFIYPGFDFRITDSMITNFHLPKSTLLMLVSAFCDKELLLNSYEEAKKNNYRFFSFGDAMLII